MEHPNLFFDRRDIAAYRELLKTDAEVKARYDAAVSGAEECLQEKFVTQDDCDASNFGAINGQANRLLNSLGVKYLVDGDRRCLEKLKEMIRHFCAYERWYGTEYYNRKPLPWHSDLFSTAAALALGKTYDLIHDALTPEEQKELAEGLFERGIKPAFDDWLYHETRLHAVDSMGHNWWAVCIGEPAVAFLAIAEHLPRGIVEKTLAEIDDALAAFLSFGGNQMFNKIRTYDENGLFYESMGYGDYATGTLLRYLGCYERIYGRNEKIRAAIPENMVDAFLSFIYPVTGEGGKQNYMTLDLGDNHIDNHIVSVARGALQTGLDSAGLRAVAAMHSPEVWDEIGGLHVDKLQGDLNTVPKHLYFPSGFTMLRDSWAPDSTLLAIKSGFAWNHSHNDAGHFMIFHKGKAFFIDSCNCSYSNEIYRDYFCQDMSHNVLRIGGKGNLHDDVHFATRFPGKLSKPYEGDGYVYVQADCSGPKSNICTRMYRNFIWIDNRILVILDDVFCHEPDTLEFLLHFKATYARQGGEENAILFDNGVSRARFVSHEPAGMRLTEKIGYPPHEPDKEMIYLELSTRDKAQRHLLISSLELDNDLHKTQISALAGEDEMTRGLSVSGVGNGKEYEIWFNRTADGRYMHDNSLARIKGFETDAYMLIFVRDTAAGTEKVRALGCSILRRDGQTLIGEYAKKNTEVSL